MYSSIPSLTSALEEWVVRDAPRPLNSLEKSQYPLYSRLSGPHSGSAGVRKISPPTGIRSPHFLIIKLINTFLLVNNSCLQFASYICKPFTVTRKSYRDAMFRVTKATTHLTTQLVHRTRGYKQHYKRVAVKQAGMVEKRSYWRLMEPSDLMKTAN